MYHGQEVPGFPQHPHRGFETVTVVRRGLLDHSDSLGADSSLRRRRRAMADRRAAAFFTPRCSRSSTASVPNPVELFQIWLNLPRASKFVDPLLRHAVVRTDPAPNDHRRRWPDDRAHRGGRTIRRRRTAASPAALLGRGGRCRRGDLDHQDGARRALDPSRRGAPTRDGRSTIFVGKGLRVDGREIPSSHEVELRPGREVALEGGADDSELLLLQGRPIGEPVVQYGPFVMNTREEIQQAFADYQRTGFGGWPWPSDEPVHPRGEGRFARRPDGTIERPT